MLEKCPICNGTGYVPLGFYSGFPTGASTTTVLRQETCRSCTGKGYIETHSQSPDSYSMQDLKDVLDNLRKLNELVDTLQTIPCINSKPCDQAKADTGVTPPFTSNCANCSHLVVYPSYIDRSPCEVDKVGWYCDALQERLYVVGKGNCKEFIPHTQHIR